MAIDAYYQKAIQLGADAVVDFDLQPVAKEYSFRTRLVIEGIEISGFAIKRN